MDLITQGLLGGVIGQAGFARKLGLRRATLWGAAIGMAPDIDVIIKHIINDPMAEQLYHRGFSHSLFFAPLVAPIAAVLTQKIYEKFGASTSRITWFYLWFWALITHPLLDWFTTYGTQLLHPISKHRFALDAISVIDFHYSGVLLTCLAISPFLKKKLKTLSLLATLGLTLSTSYLFFGIAQREESIKTIKEVCTAENINYTRISSFPMAFDVRKRRISIQTPRDIRTTFYDTRVKNHKKWNIFKQSIISGSQKFEREIEIFKWFCNNWNWVEKKGKKTTLWDARYFNKNEFMWGLEISGEKLVKRKNKSFKSIKNFFFKNKNKGN